ncbi:MAG: RNA-binding protein [Chromatiales bacterium]|nr:RNA-binding protein [Chromatiales bacterium]
MKFPPFSRVLKALVVAIVLAVAGYFLYPTLGLIESSAQHLALTLAVGALLGGILSAIEFSGATAKTDSGEKKTIFVGNLAFKASPDELTRLFAKYGNVQSVRIMKDRATRRPRGFAFVEMDAHGAARAIKKLDGMEFLGRNLRVNEGADRKEHNEAA